MTYMYQSLTIGADFSTQHIPGWGKVFLQQLTIFILLWAWWDRQTIWCNCSDYINAVLRECILHVIRPPIQLEQCDLKLKVVLKQTAVSCENIGLVSLMPCLKKKGSTCVIQQRVLNCRNQKMTYTRGPCVLIFCFTTAVDTLSRMTNYSITKKFTAKRILD